MADEVEGDETTDLQAAFDSILMLEQSVAADGFREGYEKGRREGVAEGLALAGQLGFIRGAASAWVSSANNTSDPSSKGIEAMRELLKQFEQLDKRMCDLAAANDAKWDAEEECSRLRTLYKRACSLLGTSSALPESGRSPSLSF